MEHKKEFVNFFYAKNLHSSKICCIFAVEFENYNFLYPSIYMKLSLNTSFCKLKAFELIREAAFLCAETGRVAQE